MHDSTNVRRLVFRAALIMVVLIVLVVSTKTYGQVAGAILSGIVSDPVGAAIPNATVSAQNTATGVVRTVTTNADGVFSLPNLLPGKYILTASAQGFSTKIQTDITLEVGASQTLNIALRVGELSEKVVVTGETPAVQLATSSISGEVNATTVRELPLNGRDWTSLATLQPGVTAVRTQVSTSTTSNRGNRGFGNLLADSGHRPYQNNYRFNGISIVDYANGAPGNTIGAAIGVDAIQEFSVVTSNYSAEYGRTSGAVINAISKSGTNEFHGDAYWFLRNGALDARNFFDGPTIPPFRRNQFGIAAGTPIIKDRTFIFANYEGIRQYKSISFHNLVPTAAARQGNLCSVPTTGACTPNTVTVDPSIEPYLAFYPLPNAGLVPTGNGDTGFYNLAGYADLSENYFSVRVDHKLSDRDNLSFNFLTDTSPLQQTDPLVLSVSEVNTTRKVGSLEETHIFSSTFTNSARLGFSRFVGLVQQPVKALNPLADDSSLGAIPGANSPIITVPGLTTMQGALHDPGFFDHTWNSFQFYDDAFMSRGAHSLKFGFAMEHMQYNLIARPTPNGTFSFPSLSGFLQNQATSASFLSPDFQQAEGNRQTLFGGYVQDDWRVRSRFTLNLGLRYEMTTLPTESQGRFSIIQNLYGGTPAPVNHLWQRNQTLRNFEPRVGFAWDPFGKGKTAVRGAFGIYDMLPLPGVWGFSQGDSYPFIVRNSISLSGADVGPFPTGAYEAAGFVPTNLLVSYYEQKPKRSYVMNWNLNVQQDIGWNTTVLVGYVGSHSVHQATVVDDQDMVLPTLTEAGYLYPYPVGSGTKLNPNVGAILGTYWDGSATYSGFHSQVTKRMGRGVQIQGSYTLGRCIDMGSGGGPAGNPFTNSLSTPQFFDIGARRGPCDFDIHQALAINYIWLVPTPKFGGSLVGHALGGWQLSSIVTLGTGTPFTPLIAGDPLGQKNKNPNAYPDRSVDAGCSSPINVGDVNDYLKLNCFTPPIAPASFAAVCQPAAASVAAALPNTCMNLMGNSGRNSVYGPGLVNFDFSLVKNNYIRKISETFNVQFRAEFFNIFNRPNFGPPIDNSNILNQNGTTVAGAGAIDNTTTDSRQIQFALKLNW
jgi:Carboxypeptidase regulatory-like domain